MATTKKTAPLLAALATVNDLDEQERAARAHRDQARAHLADLLSRNQSGDSAVSGLDLMTARADVEAAEGLAEHAAKVLAEAQAEHAALYAAHAAEEVRSGIEAHDIDLAVKEATEAATAALTGLKEALQARDAASDAAGQRLADAGVRPGHWVNGIRYLPVRSLMGTGPALPGQFNVEVQTADGRTAWLSSTGSDRDTARTLNRAIDAVLASATATLPLARKAFGSGRV